MSGCDYDESGEISRYGVHHFETRQKNQDPENLPATDNPE
jgi:hypothetical protein